MASRNGGQHYNVQMYNENMGDGSQDVYLEGEGYDEYDEEYVQLADGSLVPATSEEELNSQHITYRSVNNYPERVQNGHVNATNHQNVAYAVRKPNVYRVVKTEGTSAQTPPVYKYPKTSAPLLREDKHLPLQHVQQVHQPSQPMYHVVHQPSVSYSSYDSAPSTNSNSSPSSTSGTFHQAYQFASQHKNYDVKPTIPKSNKRKALAGQRKPCNCTKSACLKLYCDCFANGEFCRDCNCKDCHNNMEFEADRTRAIKQSLERNPNAFKPKIGVSKPIGATAQDVERLHQKGCHCKKSGCLKNYCECYEAKVPCTERCKCKGCQNTEADRAVRFKDKLPGSTLLGALSGGTITSASSAAKARNGHDSESESDNEQETNDPRGYPWFYMTDEVIDAATMCMVAQAEEALAKPEPNKEEMERLVLREFGRCLEQIITSTGLHPAI